MIVKSPGTCSFIFISENVFQETCSYITLIHVQIIDLLFTMKDNY